MNSCIYIITHKQVDLNIPEGYKIILVGAETKELNKVNYLFDNSGKDNISIKNANYCELTGMYWIWKNDTSEIKGLVHYRRFFTKNRFSKSSKFYFNENDVCKILNNHDIIVAEKNYVKAHSIKESYEQLHKKRDWDNLRYIIKKYYPSYFEAFSTVENSNWFFPYNMLICETDIFNAYSCWLFDVLNKLEEITDISDYNSEQARIYGFISERLLAVWIINNNLSYYEAPIIQTDSRIRYRIRRYIERKLNKRFLL